MLPWYTHIHTRTHIHTHTHSHCTDYQLVSVCVQRASSLKRILRGGGGGGGGSERLGERKGDLLAPVNDNYTSFCFL